MMKSFARPIAALSAVIAVAMVTSGPVAADNFPTRPVTIINPLAAGGGVDISLRGLAQEMQKLLGQPVVVESRPGAGGLIAGDFLARAKPDGYTIGLLQSTQALPEVYSALTKAPYTSQNLRPIARYMQLVYGLPSRTDVPWTTLPQLVEHIKANPNTVRWGRTTGLGHPLHLLAFALHHRHDLKVIEVPMKGASDAIANLLGGHIDVAFGLSTSSLEPHVQSGALRILAIHHPQRLPQLPDAPTFLEQGLDPGVMAVYNTLFAPAGTPDEVVSKLHDAVKAAMETQALKDYANKHQFELYYGSVQDIEKELEKDRMMSSQLVEKYLSTK